MLGEPEWTQGGRRWDSSGPHFFKTFPPKTSGSFTNNASTLVLENTQGRVRKAFQKEGSQVSLNQNRSGGFFQAVIYCHLLISLNTPELL